MLNEGSVPRLATKGYIRRHIKGTNVLLLTFCSGTAEAFICYNS